jgi:hypothetical protein
MKYALAKHIGKTQCISASDFLLSNKDRPRNLEIRINSLPVGLNLRVSFGSIVSELVTSEAVRNYLRS